LLILEGEENLEIRALFFLAAILMEKTTKAYRRPSTILREWLRNAKRGFYK